MSEKETTICSQWYYRRNPDPFLEESAFESAEKTYAAALLVDLWQYLGIIGISNWNPFALLFRKFGM